MADAFGQQLWFSRYAGSGGSITSLSLNDTDNSIATIMQADTADAITHIGFRHTSTTGTSPTYKASIQGIGGTTGNPDGTIKGGGSPASATFSPTSLGYGAATWQWVALDNSYTPSRGEHIALVIAYDSGTVNGSNFSSFAYALSEPLSGRAYGVHFQTVWTKNASQPTICYKTASGTYGTPIVAMSSISFGSPAEYGLKFTVPSGWHSTYKLAGVSFLANCPSSSTYSVNLYDGGAASDTTVLQSLTSADGDFSGSGNRPQEFRFTDATLATLTAGNTYRVSLAAHGAGSAFFHYIDVGTSSDWQRWGLGDNACWTTRSGGNWTDTTTRRPIGALILADITGGGGGGGSSPLILPVQGLTGIGQF